MYAQETDKMRKIIIKLLKKVRFQLDIETKLKNVDFWTLRLT